MNLDTLAEIGRADLGRRLAGMYLRTLIWYFLGMLLLWVAGFEGIYAHPTPFYATYTPAFDSLFIPGFMVLIISAVYLLFTAVGSYEAFHVTESVEFCGKLCHSVMKPQYTLYYGSPHAKVPCASCHVGPGASWFVRSKLSANLPEGSGRFFLIGCRRSTSISAMSLKI